MRGSHQRNPLKVCSDGLGNDAMQKLTLMTVRKFKFSRVSIPPNPHTFLYPSLIAKPSISGIAETIILVEGTLFLHNYKRHLRHSAYECH